MTLNLLVTGRDQIHMCCDFRLTDPVTNATRDDKTLKLTSVVRPGWSALVGVSGVGALGGQNIGEWAASKINSLPFRASLDDLLDVLKSAETDLAVIQAAYRRHTFTVSAIVNGRPLVAMVSNFQSLDSATELDMPSAGMLITRQLPSRVRVYIAGSGAKAVPARDIVELEALVRSGASAQRIQEKLIETNGHAAGPTVSRGCYVASQFANGTGSARPYLTEEQPGDFIPPEMFQLLNRLGVKLIPKTDAEGNPEPIRMDQGAYAVLEMSRAYFKREFPRRPEDPELWNNYGVFLKQGRHFKEAEAAFREAIKINPAYVPARSNLAGLLAARVETRAEGLAIYRDLVTNVEVSTDVRSDFALWLEADNDLDGAEREHAAAATVGNSARAMALYATFLWKKRNRVEGAGHIFAEDRVVSANDPDTLLARANFEWWVRGRLDLAEELFTQASAAGTKNQWVLRAYGDFLLSEKHDATSALSYYRQVNKIVRHTDPFLESNEGFALLAVGGRPDRAIARFRRALRLDPDIQEATTNLALALYLNGQATAAEQILDDLASRAELRPSVALEANALRALFHRDAAVREESKRELETRLQSGISLDKLFTALLIRYFRGSREVEVIQGWARQ
jgi:Tfp pilus assembly protein PilF